MKRWLPWLVVLPAMTAGALPLSADTTPLACFDVLEPSVPAGTAVHVDAGALFVPASREFDLCLSWNFGDSTPVPDPTGYAAGAVADVGFAWPGRYAAHRYLTAGVYTITLTERQRNADGSAGVVVATLTKQVTVTPAGRRILYVDGMRGSDGNAGTDPARPLQTADRANQLLASNTEIRFAPGQVYRSLTTPNLSRKSNVVYGVPWRGGMATIYRPAGGDFFTIGRDTRDFTVNGLVLDSACRGSASGPGISCVGILRGTNITLADCQFGHIAHGPQGDPSLHGAYLLRCVQVQPRGCGSNLVWWEGTGFDLAGCQFLGSAGEPTIRADGNGTPGAFGIRNSSIVYTRTGQVLDPHGHGNGKEGLTVRYGSGIDLWNNLCVDAHLRLNAPGLSEANALSQTIDNADVRHNLCIGLNANSNAGDMEVLPGARNCAVQDNLSYQPSQCYLVRAKAPPAIQASGLTWRNNHGGTIAANGVLLHGAAPLPDGFSVDIAMPAAQISGAAQGLTVPAPRITGPSPATMPTVDTPTPQR